MDPNPPDDDTGSLELQAICVQCGLCCGDALFGSVPLKDEEKESLADLFTIIPNSEGGHFALPCPHLSECRCTIYDRRPKVCRGFRCKTLAELSAGSIGNDEAMRRIAAIRQAMQDLRPHLQPGESLHQARVRRGKLGGEPGRVDPKAAAFTLKIVALDLLLDRYLRSGKARQIAVDPINRAMELHATETPGVEP